MTIREMMKIEILEKRLIKSEHTSRAYRVYYYPRISILIHNSTDKDIFDIDLIWKLFECETDTLIDNNLNIKSKTFNMASTDKFEYSETTTKKSITKNKKYKMKIIATSKSAELKVIDKIKNVQLIGF